MLTPGSRARESKRCRPHSAMLAVGRWAGQLLVARPAGPGPARRDGSAAVWNVRPCIRFYPRGWLKLTRVRSGLSENSRAGAGYLAECK